MKKIIVLLSALLLFGASANGVAAQKAHADGWVNPMETNDINTVKWYYKIEANAIKLKWEREYSRHRGSTIVFKNLTIACAYSIGPAAGRTHRWIAGKVVVKGS